MARIFGSVKYLRILLAVRGLNVQSGQHKGNLVSFVWHGEAISSGGTECCLCDRESLKRVSREAQGLCRAGGE